MNWLPSWLSEWLKILFKKRRPRYVKRYVADMPDKLESETIYIVGEGGHLWFVAMKCPCNCGDIIQLSLEHDSSPRWDLSEHSDGTISLYPSIWRNKRCLAHFWINRSDVKWCEDSGIVAPPQRASR